MATVAGQGVQLSKEGADTEKTSAVFESIEGSNIVEYDPRTEIKPLEGWRLAIVVFTYVVA